MMHSSNGREMAFVTFAVEENTKISCVCVCFHLDILLLCCQALIFGVRKNFVLQVYCGHRQYCFQLYLFFHSSSDVTNFF
jgi:hypothetical protein